MSIRPDLAGLRILVGLLALTVLPACGQIEVPVNLNLDPSGPNELTLSSPDGFLYESALSGGVGATIILDTDKLLTWRGVFATLRVDEIRIAGTGFMLFDQLPTGTICLTQDPDMASGGFAYLRPLFKKNADIQLTLASLAFVTSPFLSLAPPLPFGATLETQVPLSLSDLAALAAGEGGSLTITETITDTLPDDIQFLGGAELAATVTLSNSDMRASGPLVEECDAFFAAQP